MQITRKKAEADSTTPSQLSCFLKVNINYLISFTLQRLMQISLFFLLGGKEMKIENGDIVTLRNGEQYFYIENRILGAILVQDNKHISFDAYDEYLRIKRDVYNKPWGEPLDIVKVECPISPNKVLDFKGPTMLIWSEETNPLIPKEVLEFLKDFPTLDDYTSAMLF